MLARTVITHTVYCDKDKYIFAYQYHLSPSTSPILVRIRNTIKSTRIVITEAMVYPTVSPKQHLIMNHKHESY